jgi:hypothetical protein
MFGLNITLLTINNIKRLIIVITFKHFIPVVSINIIIIIIIIIINCKWVCTRLQWYYNTQYNIIEYNTQNNTYTLKTIHNTKITNTITQNYKQFNNLLLSALVEIELQKVFIKK